MSNKLLAWFKGDNSAVDSEDSHDAIFSGLYVTDADGTWFKLETGESVAIPDHVDFNFKVDGEFFIEFDYKTSSSGSDAIFAKRNAFLLSREFNENAQCYSFVLRTGLPEPQVYSTPVNTGIKYKVKITYSNSGTYDIYLNDVKLTPDSYIPNPILESIDGFTFRYREFTGSQFLIKEIKIYVVEDTPVPTNPNWTLSEDDDPLTVLKSEQYCDIKDADDEEDITKRDALLNLLGEMITAQMIDYLDNTDIDPDDPPLVLRRAALKQTTYEFKQKRTPGLQSVQYTDGSTQKYQIDEWLLDVKKILERHIKITL